MVWGLRVQHTALWPVPMVRIQVESPCGEEGIGIIECASLRKKGCASTPIMFPHKGSALTTPQDSREVVSLIVSRTLSRTLL